MDQTSNTRKANYYFEQDTFKIVNHDVLQFRPIHSSLDRSHIEKAVQLISLTTLQPEHCPIV